MVSTRYKCCAFEYMFTRLAQAGAYSNRMPAQIHMAWCLENFVPVDVYEPNEWRTVDFHDYFLGTDILPSDFFTGLRPVYLTQAWNVPLNWETSCTLDMLLSYFHYLFTYYPNETYYGVNIADGGVYDGHPYQFKIRRKCA